MGIMSWLLDPVLIAIRNLSLEIAVNQAELQAELESLTAQADKIKAEALAAIAALEAAVANGQTSPEVNAALAGLRASVQGVDDINPDAP